SHLCKLSPEPKARVSKARYGLFNFPPVVEILFLFTPAPKMHIPFQAPGRECGIFGAGVKKKHLFLYNEKCEHQYKSKKCVRSSNHVFLENVRMDVCVCIPQYFWNY
ncbi:hypothetical protein TSAR_004935, partial [Trichomalopsis sarcophagae]